MSKIYTGQDFIITLTLSSTGTLTDATSAVIKYKKPSGSEGQWTGVLSTTAKTVAYTMSDTMVSSAEYGGWRLQPVVTFSDGKIIPGETVVMDIAKRFT